MPCQGRPWRPCRRCHSTSFCAKDGTRRFYGKVTALMLAFIVRRLDHTMDRIPDHPVGRRWRAHMADILETVEGIVPRVEPLERMFVLSADDKK